MSRALRRKRKAKKNAGYCKSGKFCYHSEGAADSHLEWFRKLPEKSEKLPVRSYLCPHCGFWHLTSESLGE